MFKTFLSYLICFLIGVGMMLTFFKPVVGVLILFACGLIYNVFYFNADVSKDLMP